MTGIVQMPALLGEHGIFLDTMGWNRAFELERWYKKIVGPTIEPLEKVMSNHVIRILVVFVLLLGVLACGSPDDSGSDVLATCEYGGQIYQGGDTFPDLDGCNTCNCTDDGYIQCTEMACVTTCEYDGMIYEAGDSFPADDGCNTCQCQDDGTVGCTEEVCPTTCEYGDETYNPGDTFPADDGCNTCTCGDDGSVACTEMACSATCSHEGETYNVGDSFPAADGCNTCTCEENGAIACTEMLCSGDCEYEGTFYNAGDTFPASDGCNSCTCQEDGQVACTLMGCVPEGCHYNGYIYPYGTGGIPSTDGCNTCFCNEDGEVAGCTKMACAPFCLYAGEKYSDGESFTAIDGCNTCTCQVVELEGELTAHPNCTKMGCPCDPELDWYRDYVSTDPMQCEVIDFACAEGTTVPFNNSCGCGCEQHYSCPPSFDCSPNEWNSVCDGPALADMCPNSILDYGDTDE